MSRRLRDRILRRPPKPDEAVEEHLAPLPPDIGARLLSMYRVEDQLGSDGQRHPLDARTRISLAQGLELRALHARERP